MGDVLVVAEAADGHIKKTTHSAVTFARQAAQALGGSFTILVLGGPGTRAAAKEIANLGAAKILVAEDASLKDYVAERYAPTVAKAGEDFQVIVATASSFGKDLMPRVAARFEAGYVGDVIELIAADGSLSYRRPMFAGNAFGVATVATEPEILTVRQSAFTPAEPSGGDLSGPLRGDSPIESFAVSPFGKAAARVEFVSLEQVKNERPDLGEAKVVVSGGRALKEKFAAVIEPLADVLGAGIGASRAACDAGYCGPDLQVGQTGKIVAPQLYIAVGISGAIQHLAGMKGSKTIVAINKDAEAPIFQVADYGLVADLFTAVPELVEQIKAAKA